MTQDITQQTTPAYRVVESPMGRLIERDDGAIIPEDPANRDYAAFLQWVEAGGTPVLEPSRQSELGELQSTEFA